MRLVTVLRGQWVWSPVLGPQATNAIDAVKLQKCRAGQVGSQSDYRSGYYMAGLAPPISCRFHLADAQHKGDAHEQTGA